MTTIYRYEWLLSLSFRAPRAEVFFIGLFLLFWPITNVAATEMRRSFHEQASLSTERILLDLGSTRIAIPRNNLTSLLFSGDDFRSALALAVVVYPGFEGATAKNIANILRPKGYGIGAIYFSNTAQGSDILNSDNTWKRRPWYRGPGIDLEPSDFGLWKQKDSEANLRIWLGATDAETVTVGCGGRTCQVIFFAEGYFWRAHMGQHLYLHWQDVTNKLRELITEWVEAANEGKK